MGQKGGSQSHDNREVSSQKMRELQFRGIGLRVRVIGRLVGQEGGSQSHDNREVSSQKMRNSNSGLLDSKSALSGGYRKEFLTTYQ